MADEQIQILIKAVDDATLTLKKIESQVVTTAKNSEKANTSLAGSFKAVQGTMLNLGQIAQGVHNIFETGERVTRNLENAQDRLENATLRLKGANQDLTASYKKLNDIEKAHERDSLSLEQAQLDLEQAQADYNAIVREGVTGGWDLRQAEINLKNAQLDLKDAQGLGTKKSEEYAQAQKEIKDKEDALIISNNNLDRATRGLAKATEDASWAYMDMGVQAVSVAGNIAMFAQGLPAVISLLGGTSSGITAVGTSASTSTTALGVAGGTTGLLGSLGALAGIGVITVGIAIAWKGIIEGAEAAKQFRQEYEGLFGGGEEIQYNDVTMGMTRQLQSGSAAGKNLNLTLDMDINPFKNASAEATNVSKDTLNQINAAKELGKTGMAELPISAFQNVEGVKLELDKIPKDIYTYHHIITVYGTGGGSKSTTKK